MGIELRYYHLITHTLPGAVVVITTIAALYLLGPIVLPNYIHNNFGKFTGNLVVMGVGFIVFATIAGIVIDGVNHYIFSKYTRKNEDADFKGYESIRNLDQLEIYKYLIDESYYYYYEAYSNTALSILPGIIIVPCCLHHIGIDKCYAILVGIFLLLIVYVLFREAKVTYDLAIQMDSTFKKNMFPRNSPRKTKKTR